MIRFALSLVLLFSYLQFAAAEEISQRVVGWNVESGGAKTSIIADRLTEEDGVDIWGLSEVSDDDDAKEFELAAESDEGVDFKRIVGTTGHTDRLAVIYNAARLDVVDVEELHRINIGGRVRAPLVVHFKGKTTGKEFLFMVNHLYRGSADGRHQQAKMLNQWAKDQSLPVIAVGDYNFDFHFQSGDVDHDAGLDHMLENAVWTWVRPEVLVPTNASRHQSVLDFVFVSGEAAGWQFKSTILKKNGDFPDSRTKSDHRPVDAIFTLDPDTPGPIIDGVAEAAEAMPSRTDILRRIDALQQELDELRSLLDEGEED